MEQFGFSYFHLFLHFFKHWTHSIWNPKQKQCWALCSGSGACPPVSEKELSTAAAYQISFMFLKWVPAAEPEFVDSQEKIYSDKIDLAQNKTSGNTAKFLSLSPRVYSVYLWITNTHTHTHARHTCSPHLCTCVHLMYTYKPRLHTHMFSPLDNACFTRSRYYFPVLH